MEINWIAVLVAGLVPTLTGYIWYELIMKKAWIKSTGHSEEYLMGGNMAVKFGVSVLLAMFLSMVLNFVILISHGNMFMDKCPEITGTHATFPHGMLHGAMFAIFFAVPVLVMNGLFERKTWSNIFIHVAYWVMTMALMGGVLDAWR